MSDCTVFYSWQSDLPQKVARDLIHESLVKAVASISEASVVDSPRVDQAAEGVCGSPSITETIFSKITTCAAFVADVSIVGETIRSDLPKKKLPNPNVFVEVGYALGVVGENRTILVMNEAYGKAEELPFDLRHRRFPIRYTLGDDRSKADEVRTKLAAELGFALKSVLQEEHTAVTRIISKLDAHTLDFITKNSSSRVFRESRVENSTDSVALYHLSIGKLLELGVIECRLYKDQHGYNWTYFGKLCLARLKLPLPDESKPYPEELPELQPKPKPVAFGQITSVGRIMDKPNKNEG